MKRILKTISLILLVITLGVGLIFYTPDIKQEDLNDRYLTDHSHYIDLSIKSLDGESLPITVNYQDRLESIETPTLLLWGEQDQWIPVETVDIFKAALSLSDENIIIYPDLGHVPMEENLATVDNYLVFLGTI